MLKSAIDRTAFDLTLARARQKLLDARTAGGHWVGRLSSSALSTATALCALWLADRSEHERLIAGGVDWLAQNQNGDGGWGDTVSSRSNISTTTLVWAAFAAAEEADRHAPTLGAAESWLTREAGGVDPSSLAKAISARYGEDRTFSVPILTMCALSGKLGEGRAAWKHVRPLPFEFAAVPHRLFRWLRLGVVSYAIPALIALGQVRFRKFPPRDPFTHLLRTLARRRTLRVLESMQPSSGGFLEAIPLTSFVVMSLVEAGARQSPVVERGIAFLTDRVRSDGSWPIDTNLSTWTTTLSVNSLAAAGDPETMGTEKTSENLAFWLLDQQHRAQHPFTHAVPGGWAWTDLPGGVPDADDTAGALCALFHLGVRNVDIFDAVGKGIAWLVGLQNRDGGVPTFCRGWSKLPFDQSCADLTAHALRALGLWEDEPEVSESLRKKIALFRQRALAYLARCQEKDGSWIPLWFGNEHAPLEQNRTYGTANVVSSLCDETLRSQHAVESMVQTARNWLTQNQNTDGGWGGAAHTPSSIEETALALDALARFRAERSDRSIDAALARGIGWLLRSTNRGTTFRASPIGLYFAKLWYSEELYPLIFTVAALGRIEALLSE